MDLTFLQTINSAKAEDWPKSVKDEIIDLIKGIYSRYTIVDIQIVGSHCFGGWAEESDVDITVYVTEPDIKYSSNASLSYKLVNFDVKVETAPKPIGGQLTRKVYVGHTDNPDGWYLPSYSLTENKPVADNIQELDTYVLTNERKKKYEKGIKHYVPKS